MQTIAGKSSSIGRGLAEATSPRQVVAGRQVQSGERNHGQPAQTTGCRGRHWRRYERRTGLTQGRRRICHGTFSQVQPTVM